MLSITFTPGDLTAEDRKALLTFLNAGPVAAVTQPPLAPTAPANDADGDDNGPAAPYTPGERDANGLPWDERIHSSNHQKTSGGTWRKKRGVSDAVVTTVEAELRATNAAPAPAPTPVPAAPAPVPAAPVPAAPAPAAAGVPDLPNFLDVRNGTPPAPTVTPSAPTNVSFIDIMRKVTELQQSGKDPAPTLASVGVTQLAQLAPPDASAQALRDMAMALLAQM